MVVLARCSGPLETSKTYQHLNRSIARYRYGKVVIVYGFLSPLATDCGGGLAGNAYGIGAQFLQMAPLRPLTDTLRQFSATA